MQQHYEHLATYQREGFDIIVDKTWEDMNPRDHFDECDVDQICQDINSGTQDWFLLRVRVMIRGHVLGSDYLGGMLYADARECLTDGAAEGCIEQAMAEAVQEGLLVTNALKKLCLEQRLDSYRCESLPIMQTFLTIR